MQELLTRKRKKEIAVRYYQKGIDRVYGVFRSDVRKVIHENKKQAEPKDWCVIKVEKKNIPNAMRVLNSHYIPYEVPEKFTLEEIHESKKI